MSTAKKSPPVQVTLCARSARMAMAAVGVKATGTAFVFQDNQDSTCTVLGADVSGNHVNIDSVATLAVVSSDPTAVSVDAPVGMTFKMHGLKSVPEASPVTVSVVATWNDGTMGPFNFDLPVAVTGPANSLVVVPGTPIVR